MDIIQRYKHFQRLVLENSEKIMNAFKESWNDISFDKKEDEIILEYVTELGKGVDYLDRELSMYEYGFNVKFASIFSHSKPIVTRIGNCKSDKNNCELGDILIIFNYMDRNNNTLGNRAFLAQVKKHYEIKNQCQRCLYDEDNEFLMPKYLAKKSECCRRRKRKFLKTKELRRKTLKYLILDNEGEVKIIGSPWNKKNYWQWSVVMLKFMLGYEGYQFSKKPPKNCSWSSIIWDLISITAQSKYKGKERGINLEIITREFLKLGLFGRNMIGFHKKKYFSNNGIMGIPLIYIQVKDMEIV